MNHFFDTYFFLNSVFPPLPPADESAPTDGPVISALGKLSLFPPTNSMVPDTDIPVRIIQGGVGTKECIVDLICHINLFIVCTDH